MKTFHFDPISWNSLKRLIAFSFAMVLQFRGANQLLADWPGLLGANRDGHASAESRLPQQLSAGQPKLLWKTAAGQGYAGGAIAGSQAVLFDRAGDKDRVRLVDANTGREIWKRELKATYRGGLNSDLGPRCVPTITDSSVLIYSASGELSLLSRKDGTVKWTLPLRNQYSADDGYFGAGSTPLVIEGKAIVNVGGKSISVVCVSLKDGKILWTGVQGEASYASPIAFRGTAPNTNNPIIVVPTRLTTVGLELDSGKERWRVPFGQRGPTVNAATPILVKQEQLFLTASYGIGSITIAPRASTAEVIRKGSQIASQYTTPVVVEGRILGCDGREDGDPAIYKCLNADDESLRWEKSDMPISHSIVVDKQVLICGIDGQIWNINATEDSFKPLWTAQLPAGKYRAIPAYDGQRLLTRTSEADNTWYCYEFR